MWCETCFHSSIIVEGKSRCKIVPWLFCVVWFCNLRYLAKYRAQVKLSHSPDLIVIKIVRRHGTSIPSLYHISIKNIFQEALKVVSPSLLILVPAYFLNTLKTFKFPLTSYRYSFVFIPFITNSLLQKDFVCLSGSDKNEGSHRTNTTNQMSMILIIMQRMRDFLIIINIISIYNNNDTVANSQFFSLSESEKSCSVQSSFYQATRQTKHNNKREESKLSIKKLKKTTFNNNKERKVFFEKVSYLYMNFISFVLSVLSFCMYLLLHMPWVPRLLPVIIKIT